MPKQFRLTDTLDGFTVIVSGDEPPDEATTASIIDTERKAHQAKLLAKTRADAIAPPPSTPSLLDKALSWGAEQGQAIEEPLSQGLATGLDEGAKGNILSGAGDLMVGAGKAGINAAGSLIGGLANILPATIKNVVESGVPGANLADPAMQQVDVGLHPNESLTSKIAVKAGAAALNGVFQIPTDVGEGIMVRSPKLAEWGADLAQSWVTGGGAFKVLGMLGKGGKAASLLVGAGFLPQQVEELQARYDSLQARAKGGDFEGALKDTADLVKAIGFLYVGGKATLHGGREAIREQADTARAKKYGGIIDTLTGETPTQERAFGRSASDWAPRAFGREGKVIPVSRRLPPMEAPTAVEGQVFYVPPTTEKDHGAIPGPIPPTPTVTSKGKVRVEAKDIIAPPPKVKEEAPTKPEEIILEDGTVVRDGKVVGRTAESVYEKPLQPPPKPAPKLLEETTPEEPSKEVTPVIEPPPKTAKPTRSKAAIEQELSKVLAEKQAVSGDSIKTKELATRLKTLQQERDISPEVFTPPPKGGGRYRTTLTPKQQADATSVLEGFKGAAKPPTEAEIRAEVTKKGYSPAGDRGARIAQEVLRQLETTKPLQLYHGTGADITEFSAESQLGIHLTPSKEIASHFAGKGKDAGVYPVYADIKKPFRLQDRGVFSVEHVLPQLVARGIISKDGASKFVEQGGTESKLRDLLKSKGYDGVVYLNRGEVLGKGEALVSKPKWDKIQTLRDASDIEFKAAFPEATDSYIAFDNKQVRPFEGATLTKKSLEEFNKPQPTHNPDALPNKLFEQSDFRLNPDHTRGVAIEGTPYRVSDIGVSFDRSRMKEVANLKATKVVLPIIDKSLQALHVKDTTYLLDTMKSRLDGVSLDPNILGSFKTVAKEGGVPDRQIDINLPTQAALAETHANKLKAPTVEGHQRAVVNDFATNVATTIVHEFLHHLGLHHKASGKDVEFKKFLDDNMDKFLDETLVLHENITKAVTYTDIHELAKMSTKLKEDYDIAEQQKATTRANRRGTSAYGTEAISGGEGKLQPPPTAGAREVGAEEQGRVDEGFSPQPTIASKPAAKLTKSDEGGLAEHLLATKEEGIEPPPKPKRKGEEGFIQFPSRKELVEGLKGMVALPVYVVTHPLQTDRFLKGLYQSTLAGGLNTGERNMLGTIFRFGTLRTLDAMMLPFSRDAAIRLKEAGKQLPLILGNMADTAKMVKQGIIPDAAFNLDNTRIREAKALERVMDLGQIPKQLKDQFLHLFASDIMTPGMFNAGNMPKLNVGEKWTRVLMAENMVQERAMRLMVVSTELAPLMDRVGARSFEELAAKMKKDPVLAKNAMVEINGAMTTALDLTAALRAPHPALEAVTRGFAKIPLLWTTVPFFNYMVNNFALQAIEAMPGVAYISPRVRASMGFNKLHQELGKAEAEVERLKLAKVPASSQDMKDARRAASLLRDKVHDQLTRGIKTPTQVKQMMLTGPFIMAVAAAITALSPDDDKKKWYQVETIPRMLGAKKGSVMDVRPLLGPAGFYWYLGTKMGARTKPSKPSQQFYMGDTRDMLEAITNSRVGGAPELLDIYKALTADDATIAKVKETTAKVGFTYGQVAGKALTGTWISEIARNIAAGMSEEEAVDRTFGMSPQYGIGKSTIGATLQGIESSVPRLRTTLPPKYSPTTGKPTKVEQPLIQSLIGRVTVPDKLQEFIDTNKIDKKAVFPKQTHLIEYDRRMYEAWVKGVNRDIPGRGSIMSWIDNRTIPLGAKVNAVEKRLTALREEAKTSVLKQWDKEYKEKGKEPFELPEDVPRRAVEGSEKDIQNRAARKFTTAPIPGGILGKREGRLSKGQRRLLNQRLISNMPGMKERLEKMKREQIAPPPSDD